MARVSSPARRHRPRLPRLTSRPRPGGISAPRAGHEPAVDLAHGAAGADAGGWRRSARPARHQGRSARVRHYAGRRPHLAADRGGTGRRRRRLGRQRLRHLGDPRRRNRPVRRHHRSGASPGRTRRRATLRAMAGGARPRPRARGRRCRAALRSRAGWLATHCRGSAGEQFRLAHGARRHRHDRMRQLRPAGPSNGDLPERASRPAPPADASR